MRILYITTEVPYPLTSGFLRHYHFLKRLGPRHEITYVSLTRKGSVPEEAYDAIGPLVEEMTVFGMESPSEPAPIALLDAIPRIGGQYARAARLRWAARVMKRRVAGLLATRHFDVILHSGKDTWPAIADVTDTPIVIDACDATSLRVTGEMRIASASRRAWLAMRLVEVRRIERKLAAKTPYIAFASERDREAMAGPHRGVIIPQCVDLERWTPRRRAPEPATVVFTGVMSYPPNDDAAQWLATEILPRVRSRVPEARLRIVGRAPTPEVERLGADPTITVTGEPADMRDHFEQATIACAPMRFASGMQFKVLEAMAMEVPVVTTPQAADGLNTDDDSPPLVVGTSADELADGVARLLTDPAERERLSRDGRAYVADHFSWDAATAKLERLLNEAAGSPV